MINVRRFAVPAVVLLSGSLLAGCSDGAEESPTPTDAMEDVMEDDSMEDDSMEEDDAMEDDAMEDDA